MAINKFISDKSTAYYWYLKEKTMTKKFWLDWQKRIGETRNIQLFWIHLDGWKRKLHWILDTQAGDRIIKATFNSDAVDLVIERHRIVVDFNTISLKQHVENEYKTINREEIATIEFIKYNA